MKLCRHEGARKKYVRTVRSTSRKSTFEEFCGAEVEVLCKQGNLTEALSSLQSLDQQTTCIQSHIYKCLLQCCTLLKALAQGQTLHAHLLTSAPLSIAPLESTLLYMYAHCDLIKDARHIFDHMTKWDVFAWNVMIAAYTRHGEGEKAFKLFAAMQHASVHRDEITFVSILKTCKIYGNLDRGRWVHACVIMTVRDAYISIENSLLSMYAHLGCLEDAYVVFTQMRSRDVVTWTLMIAGYAMHGYAKKALILYAQMDGKSIQPDKVTLLSVLQACCSLENLERGRQVHCKVILYGLDVEAFMASTLVDLYSKCASLNEAQKMFEMGACKNLVSWNALIAGYATHGPVEEAFKLYAKLHHKALTPDKITFLNIINACSVLGDVDVCTHIHMNLVHDGLELDVQVMNSLFDMYAKCGCIDDARQVFDQFHDKDVVSWTSIISGYAKQGLDDKAFQLFETMKREGVNPDKFTFSSVLKACAGSKNFNQGRLIHAYVIQSGLERDGFIESTLVDLYSKGGHLCDARHIFDSVHNHDVVSWTTMVVAYAQHGYGKEALQLMGQMLDSGVKLNHVTLMGIFSACSHSGLVEEGQYLFDAMKQKGAAVTKTTEHYACMIDLLTRAGCLEEVERLLTELPFEPSVSMWLALLRSCSAYGNTSLAKRAAEHVLRLEPENDSAFVLLSNVCASGGNSSSSDENHEYDWLGCDQFYQLQVG